RGHSTLTWMFGRRTLVLDPREPAAELWHWSLHMDEESVRKFITDTFAGVDVLVASGDFYFYYEPDRSIPPDRRFPFATLVTDDKHDQFSNLNRPSVFRLNIGVEKATYRSLFGSQPS